MAVSFVRQNSGTGGEFDDSITVSLDATGCDFIWLFAGSTSNTNNVTSPTMTYNGVTATSVATSANSPNTAAKIWAYYVKGPASGTHNAVFAWTGGQAGDRVVVGAVGYTGVNQTTPVGTAASGSNEDFVATPSISVSSATGELVVDAIFSHAATGLTPGAGQTERMEVQVGNLTGRLGASEEAGASSVTMSWTGTLGDDWAMVGVPLKPAGGSSDNTQQPTGFGLTASVGTPTIQKSSTLSPTGFSLTASVGTPTISKTGAVLPSGFALTASVGTPTVVKGSTIAPTGFSLTASVGSPGVSTTAMPSGFGLTASIGTFTIEVNTTLAVPGFGLTASVGTPSISHAGAITPAGFGLVASLGAPTLTKTGSITPAGFGLVSSLGTPSLTKTSTSTPTGFALSTSLGAPSIQTTGNVTLNPNGFGLVALLGASAETASRLFPATGFALATSLGTPNVNVSSGGSEAAAALTMRLTARPQVTFTLRVRPPS